MSEKFLEHTELSDYKGTNFNYLSFGSERKICTGINLAEKMIMFVLAILLHYFDWKVENITNLNLSERFDIVPRKIDHLVTI